MLLSYGVTSAGTSVPTQCSGAVSMGSCAWRAPPLWRAPFPSAPTGTREWEERAKCGQWVDAGGHGVAFKSSDCGMTFATCCSMFFVTKIDRLERVLFG